MLRVRGIFLFVLLVVGVGACNGADKPAKDVADLVAPEVAVEVVPADSGNDVQVPEPVVLLTGGESAHTIVLQPGASPSEEWAAEELRSHFEACTGVVLPVEEAAEPLEGPMIVLGMGPVAEALGVGPDPEALGEQGFYTGTIPPHIVIAGTAEAGTLYGVHRFLEEHLGVRWYAPGVTKTPDITDVTVPPTDRLEKPAFLWRDTSYRRPGAEEDFLSRQAENAGDGGKDHQYGIQHDHDGRAHSYFWYVSPDEFFDEYPEYFSEIGGVRIREDTQLCLTNPDVLEIVTERMLQRMADKPHSRQHNFSQKDRYNYCQCESCSAMNAKYETFGGTQFWFVNALAERTAEVYAEKLIGTLAYMYTEEPPVDMAMHPNVAIWLCHMFPSCDSHPIESCPLNADYKRRAEAWSGITEHLYVWHYIVDFMHYYNPFPNFRAMAADMRFYRDIGVEGIYLQGMGHSGGGGEFSLLRPYYGMKLLWNPDMDPEAVRRDFLEGYYGAAADPIEKYMEILLDKVTDDDVHMHLYTNPAQGYLPDEVVNSGETLFDEAEAAVAGDATFLDRVQVARMPLVYARLFPRNGYEIVGETLAWNGELAGPGEVSWFLDMLESHGFETIREVAGQPETLPLLYSIFAGDLAVKVLENAVLRVEVVPSLAGRALRIIHKATGECVTAYNVKQNLFFTFAGGLEDRVGGPFEFYGWVEPASVTAQGDLSLSTAATTVNGYLLQRTITLHEGEPVLEVETVLTNQHEGPNTVNLRNHLELSLGELAETRVKFTSLAGETVDKDLSEIIAGMREGEHFYAEDAPDGQWTFSGTKGLEVTQSFDNSQVDYTWAYAYPDYLGEVELEVWAPRTELQPGESITVHQALEVHLSD